MTSTCLDVDSASTIGSDDFISTFLCLESTSTLRLRLDFASPQNRLDFDWTRLDFDSTTTTRLYFDSTSPDPVSSTTQHNLGCFIVRALGRKSSRRYLPSPVLAAMHEDFASEESAFPWMVPRMQHWDHNSIFPLVSFKNWRSEHPLGN